jgi:hypothetical protein
VSADRARGRLRVYSRDAPRGLRRRWEQGRATATSSRRQLHGDGKARRDLPPPSPSATTSRPAPRSPPLPLRRPPPPLPALSLLPRRLPSPDGAAAHLRRSGAAWHLRRQAKPQRRGEDGTAALAQELRLPSSCSMQCQNGRTEGNFTPVLIQGHPTHFCPKSNTILN